MFSKPRIISTFASFVVIYFFPWIFYTYLAVDFFESQMITDDPEEMICFFYPSLSVASLWLTCFHQFIKNGVWVHTIFAWYSIRRFNWSLFWSRYRTYHVRNRNANHCNWTPCGCYILDRNLCGHWNGDQFRL